MKYSNKFMVVPFVTKPDNPEEKYLNNLDENMTKILKNNNLTVDEKLKQYNYILSLFMNKKTDIEPKVEYNPKPDIAKIVKEIVNDLPLKKEMIDINKIKSKDSIDNILDTKTLKKEARRVKRENKKSKNNTINNTAYENLEYDDEDLLNKTLLNKTMINKTPSAPKKRQNRSLRSNTNSEDYQYKDKINTMTGNGRITKWIKKKYF